MSRQKSDLEQLKPKLPGAPRRRFDPSTAFQHHNKENEQTDTPAVLKEGECNNGRSFHHPEPIKESESLPV